MPHALREAFAAIRRAPLLTSLSAVMVAMALFVVGTFGVAVFNLQRALQAVEERVEVVVYLEDNARTVEVSIAQDELARRPEVQGVRLVTKEEALERARSDFPEFADVFTDLDSNPLPASLEIQLRAGFRNAEVLEDVVHQAQLYPFVEGVRFGSEWVERLFLIRRMAGFTAALLGTAFGAVAGLIIATAIRIAVFARREEIQVMRLVGARNSFIRRPFLLEGGMTGLLGGLLALGLVYLTYRLVTAFRFEIDFLPASWIFLGILAGGLFGVLASAWALRRYLREM